MLNSKRLLSEKPGLTVTKYVTYAYIKGSNSRPDKLSNANQINFKKVFSLDMDVIKPSFSVKRVDMRWPFLFVHLFCLSFL